MLLLQVLVEVPIAPQTVAVRTNDVALLVRIWPLTIGLMPFVEEVVAMGALDALLCVVSPRTATRVVGLEAPKADELKEKYNTVNNTVKRILTDASTTGIDTGYRAMLVKLLNHP